MLVSSLHDVLRCHFFAPQTEAFSTLEDGDEGTASQSLTMEQEVTLSQSETTQQLQQEVIVIVTDTESDEEQEEEEDEDEEQVRQFCSIFFFFLKTTFKTVKICLTNLPVSRTMMTRMKKMKTRRRKMTRRMMMTERWERKERTATRAAAIATSPTKETTQR